MLPAVSDTPMDESRPGSLPEVLAQEYEALRAGSSYASASLAELYQKVHQQPEPFSALCISGGGIRSATFALGALQGLADYGILGAFDYMSTVSGGGYIGSWLTAWSQREGGLDHVLPKLRTDAPKPKPPAPDPIQHLRDFNNYLTPKLGFLSADTWTIVATVTRNMLLNWLVLTPLLLFALAMPRISLALVTARNRFGLNPPEWWVLLSVLALLLLYGLGSLAIFNAVRYLPGIGNRPHTQGDFLLYVLTPLVLSNILHCAHFHWWWVDTSEGLPSLWHEVRQGLIESYTGWLAYLVVTGFQDLRRALRMLFGPLSLAMFLLGIGMGVSSWSLFSKIYPATSITFADFVALGPPLLLVGFSIAGALFIGLTSRVLQDSDREWMGRAGAWLSLVILVWAGVFSLVLILPEYLFQAQAWLKSLSVTVGGLSGWIVARMGYSGKTQASPDDASESSRKAELVLKAAPPVFLVLFFAGLACFTDLCLSKTGLVSIPWWSHTEIVENSTLLANVLVAGAFLAVALVLARYININLFSIHAMYRNRLIRAYLGASNPTRKASAFTGFAPDDNLQMCKLQPSWKPFHVLNLTLNLVAGERLAWQQRKAEAFSVSPLACGSADLGYRSSSGYAGGMTLGTAMAISGAAASPNMGYHSSPVVGFIMTLFNARLGAWLGNPGASGAKTWRQRGPQSATRSLIREAFGLTNDRSDYVYLSDGGHFENLGLYEMVRRRCHSIVVLDSGADPSLTYEDLGNALRKIRIDMNIPVDFIEECCAPLRKRQKRCALARIRYSAADGACPDGWLLYVKPIFLGDEPPDVQSYHSAHPAFPHESTGDQWFDESQTESYRMLGWLSIREICASLGGTGLEDLRKAAESYIRTGQDARSTESSPDV